MTSSVRYELVDGIGVITVDNPPVNALSHAVRQGIHDALAAAQQDTSIAVLIVCEGRTFIAGADITEFGKPPKEPHLPDLCNSIEASSKLVVAAVHGTALGGGLEVALACHYRCAVQGARVGFPEVKLGLLPGAGGTQRLPRLIGAGAALDLMTSGNPVDAAQAANLGLIDHIVNGDLGDAALAWCGELAAKDVQRRRTSELAVESVPDGMLDAYRATLARRARGQIAPQKIVDCVEASLTLPFTEGLRIERENFIECLQSPQSAALRHMFFAEREAARVQGLSKDMPLRDVNRVGVIGAGTMGSGIAMNFANAGMQVALLEVSDEALGKGLGIIDRNYQGGVKRGKMSEEQALEYRGRITGTTDYESLSDADLVIEAVFENLELKQEVFGKLDAVCRQGAILATNTSYQNVDRIAAATKRPQDVIGLHFFSPAHIMKLLEVVRAEKTADDVLATCMALAKKIRKTPVVSGVCYGFIGNRMLGHYAREAQLCVIEGATPEQVDAVMEEWGMAMGPLAVFDLAGLDVGFKARQGLPEAERGDPRAFRVADALVEMNRLGQKTGAGFYRYDPDTRKRSSDPVVLTLIEREAAELGVTRGDIDADEIVDRLLFALVNEGMNILDEGIAQRPGDIDVVYVYGYGFPAWRGGPMHYADSVGLAHVLERVREFEQRFGSENWTPAPLLEKLVSNGNTLAEWANSGSE
ncbi:MAG: 3-hydroxyacyl-CoA dehydrogenase [Gammaproteobacteria bacterium]|jgi:3-hydroxyacyl-CoA dehydrogenase|nr:3-hydroxyacyl-CoA dehydrogenase [Gammaproteobacteria bacterium]